jgi:hypothetical protein
VRSDDREEVREMRRQLKRIAMTLAVSGVLIGGGSAIAHAAAATPTAKASSSAATSSSASSSSTAAANAADTDKCPNA